MAKKAVAKKPSTKSVAETANQDDLEAAWGQSRQKPPSTGGYGVADIPDGEYLLQVTSARVGQYKSGNKKGTRYFKISYTVAAGEHAGISLKSQDDISTREVGTTGSTALDFLSSRLQLLGVDTKAIKSTSELPAVAQRLSDPKQGRPFCTAAVSTKPYTKDDGTEGAYQNVYVNEAVSAKEAETIRARLG